MPRRRSIYLLSAERTVDVRDVDKERLRHEWLFVRLRKITRLEIYLSRLMYFIQLALESRRLQSQSNPAERSAGKALYV